MRHRSKKGKSYDSFYFMRDRRGWIPDFIHSDSSCRMDYRQVQSHGERDQFSSDRSGGLSVHPVGSRGEAYGHWVRKCANGHSGSLYWKSSKLFRCTDYLPPLSHPHRLHSQERDGKGAVAFHMDEASPLPVP